MKLHNFSRGVVAATLAALFAGRGVTPAFAQALSLSHSTNSQGQAVLTWTPSGVMGSDIQTFVVERGPWPRTTAEADISFAALPGSATLTSADRTYTDMDATVDLRARRYAYRVQMEYASADGGGEGTINIELHSNIIGAGMNPMPMPMQVDSPPSDAAVLKVVLPPVMRQIPRSIYERIRQRQRADGRWK